MRHGMYAEPESTFPLPTMKSARVVTVITLCAVLILLAWLWTPDKPRADLERLYLASPADLMTVAGTRLHVRDTGPRGAPAVLLLHGFGSSLHTWEPWARALAATHRVIRFDLPGSGLSAPDASGDYTDARSLQLLAALLDQLGVAQASVIGNSIGGRIAWKFAAAYPQRVSKLVLISPDGFASPGFAYGKPAEVPAVMGLMRYALPKPLLRMNLTPAYAQPGRLLDATVTRYHDLMLAPGSRDALLARMRQTVLEDPLPILRRIRVPTLLLWGAADQMIPVANAADYAGAIPNVRLVTLPDAGHVPFEELPAESLVPLLAFIDEAARAPAAR